MNISVSELSGHWQLVRAELDGEAAPELVVQRTELRLTRDTYAVWFAGELADRGTYNFSAAAAVPELSLHGEHGPNAGRTVPAILQLRGDRLRICFGLDGTKPETFATGADSQRYLATYRRL